MDGVHDAQVKNNKKHVKSSFIQKVSPKIVSNIYYDDEPAKQDIQNVSHQFEIHPLTKDLQNGDNRIIAQKLDQTNVLKEAIIVSQLKYPES